MGMDINSEDVADNFEQCVWEPSIVKINALTAACEACCTILSIDETIKNPNSNYKPPQGMPGIQMTPESPFTLIVFELFGVLIVFVFKAIFVKYFYIQKLTLYLFVIAVLVKKEDMLFVMGQMSRAQVGSVWTIRSETSLEPNKVVCNTASLCMRRASAESSQCQTNNHQPLPTV